MIVTTNRRGINLFFLDIRKQIGTGYFLVKDYSIVFGYIEIEKRGDAKQTILDFGDFIFIIYKENIVVKEGEEREKYLKKILKKMNNRKDKLN